MIQAELNLEFVIMTTCEDDEYNQVLKYTKSKLSRIDLDDIQYQQYAYLSCNGCFFLKPTRL